MKALFTFLILVTMTLNSQIVFSDASDPYYEKWCQSVGSILRVAVRNSLVAPSFEEEKEILLRGIEQSLNVTSPKRGFYFLTTLSNISEGLENYADIKEEVFFLRREARYALSDMEYLDQSYRNRSCPFCQEDHRPYVLNVIGRGLDEGARVKTDAQEIYALDRAATISIGMLDDSAYRRSYSCARQELTFLLNVTDIHSKRDHLRHAWQILRDQRRCH